MANGRSGGENEVVAFVLRGGKDRKEVAPEDAVYYRLDKGPNDTRVFDVEGWKKHEEKIQEGLELFGKYFRSLWT
jgi:hypothetical protein